MQFLDNNPPEQPKSLNLGWKAIAFAVVVVVLSLLLSIAAVDLVTAAVG